MPTAGLVRTTAKQLSVFYFDLVVVVISLKTSNTESGSDGSLAKFFRLWSGIATGNGLNSYTGRSCEKEQSPCGYVRLKYFMRFIPVVR
jgi:hypothetical protein